jgi:hypothetical protein
MTSKNPAEYKIWKPNEMVIVGAHRVEEKRYSLPY